MKILIIAFHLGVTSSGNLTDRVARELCKKGHEIIVLTGFSDGEEKEFKVIKCSSFLLRLSVRILCELEFIGNIIQRDVLFALWELWAYCNAKKILKVFLPDVVYARSSPGCSFNTGFKLSRKYNIPLMLHFADPIPPPPPWRTNKRYRSKITKTFLPATIHASSISFGNESMLIYQQETTSLDIQNKSFLLPNPIPRPRILNPPSSHVVVFTFLGSFIESRNPEAILTAFSMVLRRETSCELHIYGTSCKLVAKYLKQYKQLISDKVKFRPRTSDIYKVLEEATVLIDVDSNVQRQVYRSNKVMEYLSVNRFILSITPDNSPTYNILKDLKRTCFISNHCIENIKNGMLKAINTKWDNGLFNERKKIREIIGISNLSDLLEKKLLDIANNQG